LLLRVLAASCLSSLQAPPNAKQGQVTWGSVTGTPGTRLQTTTVSARLRPSPEQPYSSWCPSFGAELAGPVVITAGGEGGGVGGGSEALRGGSTQPLRGQIPRVASSDASSSGVLPPQGRRSTSLPANVLKMKCGSPPAVLRTCRSASSYSVLAVSRKAFTPALTGVFIDHPAHASNTHVKRGPFLAVFFRITSSSGGSGLSPYFARRSLSSACSRPL
jgi:hypothetical protein